VGIGFGIFRGLSRSIAAIFKTRKNIITIVVAPEEARAIAKEAYLHGFPVVETYKTLYKQAIDQASPDYRAPLGQLGHPRTVATP